MNVLERIRSTFWIYRLLVKCRRNKLYYKMEREREGRGIYYIYRERERVKGRRLREDFSFNSL